MKFAPAIIFVALLASGSILHAEDHLKANGPILDLTKFELTFEELFKRPNIVSHGPFSQYAPGMRWLAHTPWNGDFGDAQFANPGPGGPFSYESPGLSITASKQVSGKWQSGLICSVDRDGPDQQGFSQKYGYFEMRAMLPSGPGVWPSFWLIGVDKSIFSSEIDVVEYYGQFSSGFHTVMHIWRSENPIHNKFVVEVEKDSLTQSFHNFGVLIGPDRMKFYLDHSEYLDVQTPEEYKQPMYMLANLALGGGWPIDKLESPSIMRIEHIRVYKSKN